MSQNTDNAIGLLIDLDFPDLSNSIHAPQNQSKNQQQKGKEKDNTPIQTTMEKQPGKTFMKAMATTQTKVTATPTKRINPSMWSDILKSNTTWSPEIIKGKSQFSLDGTRAKDRKLARKTTALTYPLATVKETKDPRERQVVLEREPKTKKLDARLDKAMMHTINKQLTESNVPEHIRIDLARVTSTVTGASSANIKLTQKCLHMKNQTPNHGSYKKG